MKAQPRVLNTRPPPKSAALSQLLAAKGIGVVEYCPIIIEALPNLSHCQKAKDIAFNLDQFSDIVITSGFAAEIGLDFLANYWPQWPETRWWSIGSSTAKSMHSFTIDALTPSQASPHNSESLIHAMHATWNADTHEQPSPTHQKAQRVLVIAGQQGRGVLQAELSKAEVPYSILEVYQRVKNPLPLPIYMYDAIIITSVDIAKGILINDQVLIQFGHNCYFICASDRIADIVKSKGALKVVNSGSANNETVSNTITKLLL